MCVCVGSVHSSIIHIMETRMHTQTPHPSTGCSCVCSRWIGTDSFCTRIAVYQFNFICGPLLAECTEVMPGAKVQLVIRALIIRTGFGVRYYL